MKAEAEMRLFRTVKVFLSTEGAEITQEFVEAGAGIEATAVQGREVQRRSFPTSFGGDYAARGYEFIRGLGLVENAERIREEAIALLSADPCPSGEFDLILADFILPGFSGSQALQEARRLAPQTPFIFLSGVFGEEHAVNMMRSGAVDYVLKQNLGFLPKAVERAMGEVNERRRRLQAEQALREVEVRARLAIDAARLGMWDYEPQSGTLIWDERCRAMMGIAAETPVDMPLFERLCHPDDRERMREQVARAISGSDAGQFSTTYRVLFEDGRMRWMETRGQAFFDGERCTRFVGVLMDITEQQLATQTLRQMNETLGERVQERTRERDRTWELSRDLLAVTHTDMMPVALNPMWEQAFDWPLEQLMEHPLTRLVHPDDLQATLEETARVGRGKVTTRFVNRMRHRDGSYRWLSWSAVADGGRIYSAARDITSEIAAVDKLADANRELRARIGKILLRGKQD